jgi:methionine-rich copper-binding protein CopC
MTKVLRTAGTAVAIAIVTLAAVVSTPAASWASDTVVSTTPSDRAAVATAPSTVDINVGAAPDASSSHVSVRTVAGATVSTGDAVLSGQTTLRQRVSIAASGDYVVAYHVVFADGGDVVGTFRFSVGTGIAPAVPDQKTILADEAVVLQHQHDVDPMSAVLLVVDVAVVLVLLALLLRRPSPRGRRTGRWSVSFPEEASAQPPTP